MITRTVLALALALALQVLTPSPASAVNPSPSVKPGSVCRAVFRPGNVTRPIRGSSPPSRCPSVPRCPLGQAAPRRLAGIQPAYPMMTTGTTNVRKAGLTGRNRHRRHGMQR